MLAAPGSVKAYTKFEAAAYMLSAEEGGRKKPIFDHYRPQFFIRTGDITGSVKLLEGKEMVTAVGALWMASEQSQQSGCIPYRSRSTRNHYCCLNHDCVGRFDSIAFSRIC